MKIYATTTSERASKGQGGNEYLDIIITNAEQKTIAFIKIIPKRNFADISISVESKPIYFGKIMLPKETKGKQKKDENCDECIALNQSLPGLNGQGNCGNHD